VQFSGFFELVAECGEGGVGEGGPALATGRGVLTALLLYAAGMLVVVTVKAEQFPVAAVGRIIVVVVIPVVYRQLAQFFALEFAAAPAADMGEELQGLFTVPGLPLLLFLAHLCDHTVLSFGIGLGHGDSWVSIRTDLGKPVEPLYQKLPQRWTPFLPVSLPVEPPANPAILMKTLLTENRLLPRIYTDKHE